MRPEEWYHLATTQEDTGYTQAIRYPTLSYTARVEMSETEIVSIMTISYSQHAPYLISWFATKFQVKRCQGCKDVEYLGATAERSEHTYPCAIDAIEAGVAHFLRLASEVR